MSRGIRRWVALAGLAAVLVVSGCGLFNPAEPERPLVEETVPPDYTLPDSTLATIARVVSGKGITPGYGLQTLVEGLSSDEFLATFDLSDLAQYPSASPDNWNIERERAFMQAFFGLQAYPHPYRMTWSLDSANAEPGGTETDPILHRRYVVQALLPGQEPVVIAVGFADLTFHRVSDSHIVITLWADRVDPRIDPSHQDNRSMGWRRLESGS